MNELPETRASLLLRLKEVHNVPAWDEFLNVYESAVYRYARGKGLQHADAQDVTQDVLLAVHARITDWDLDRSKGSFRAWLFRVARNIAVQAWLMRSGSAVGTGDTSVVKLLAQVPEVSEEEKSQFQLEYRRSLFQWAADQVREQVQESTWKVFLQTAVDGLKAEIVAKQLNMDVGAVYTAKCRVLARIRKAIESFEDD